MLTRPQKGLSRLDFGIPLGLPARFGARWGAGMQGQRLPGELGMLCRRPRAEQAKWSSRSGTSQSDLRASHDHRSFGTPD